MAHLTSTVLDHYRRPRVLGLDILRIIASVSIILYHGNLRPFGQTVVTAEFQTNGYLAVDIFFVLSGWLLTRQLLRMRTLYPNSMALASHFWIRRWFRTLPLYWVMLIVVIVVFPWLDPRMFEVPISFSDFPRHALFLQTVFPPNAYAVSWSLVAEEWFYLALPFVVFLAARARSWRVIMGFGLAVLLVPSVERIILDPTEPPWRLLVMPHVRFDGLVVGALVAAASVGAPWWPQVIARRRSLFLLGLAGVASMLAAGMVNSWPYRIFGVLVFCVSLGMLMPLMSQLRWSKAAPVASVMLVAFLSELTYPLYLVHTLVRIHYSHFRFPVSALLLILSAFILLVCATLLHLGVERPFLALRDRLDAGRQRRAAGGLSSSADPAPWKEPAEPAETSPQPVPSPALAEPGLSPKVTG
jgi:peptidoglycan/LPS O-acetylase OafA/YrhL